jgi:hypothetical protein
MHRAMIPAALPTTGHTACPGAQVLLLPRCSLDSHIHPHALWPSWTPARPNKHDQDDQDEQH